MDIRRALPSLALCAAMFPFLANAQTIVLNYTPVDAKYSTALDRIVMVSANPNQLHIYNPLTQTDTAVGLPKAPFQVSVSPDGLFAAVSHDALVSYVNLSSASLVQTYPLAESAQTIILGETWIYLIANNTNNAAQSINIASGAISSSTAYEASTSAVLDVAGSVIYGVSQYSGGFIEYDVSTGPITTDSSSNFLNEEVCGTALWLSPDSSRIYTGCGNVFQAGNATTTTPPYLTTFAGSPSIGTLASSAAISTIATVASPLYYESVDTYAALWDTTYLQPTGQFNLPGFTWQGASVTSHGRWVFFNNAGSDLYVLMQGENSSQTDSGFAIQVFSMAPPPACGAAFSTSTATAAAPGALATASVTASASCIYRAASNASWLIVVSGGYASGNETLTYLTRPNTGVAQRSGEISISGQTFTVTQAGAGAATPFEPLAYNIVNAAYASQIDKLVFISSPPNELHIYSPSTDSDTVVALSLVPLCLSVRPDGLYAAVGHDGWISYVNLQSGTVQLIPIATQVTDIVLADNGYLYVFPSSDSNLYSYQISTGTLTALPGYYFYQYANPRLAPDGQSIYEANYNFSKWNIAAGPLVTVSLQNSPSSCNSFWFAADGSSVFTACATDYTISESEAQDLVYIGTLANAGELVYAAESPAEQTVAVIPQYDYQTQASDTEVQSYGQSYLGYAGAFALPEFTAGGKSYAGHGKYLFWNAAGTTLYAIEQADSSANLLSSFAVETIAASSYTGACAVTLGSQSANEQASFGFDSVVITTGSNCVWTATSNASWLTITQGGFAFGSGSLEFSFPANTATTPRVGTLTIAGQTFTVTQAGSIFAISGQITLYGQPLSGVTLHISGGGSTTTDGSGNYSLGNLALGGNFTVTPELDGYIFSPQSFSVQNIGANQTANFSAFRQFDFNGGTNPDVLWESPTSGWVQIWYLGGPQGVTIESAANLTLSNPWHVVGVGDFNGDGSPDVVWQDPVHGAVQVWFLGGPKGNQFMSAVNVTTSNPWQVVSVADFNQDGHPDLLWEDPVSGWAQIWYLGGPQGTTFLGAANLTLKNPWHIVGTGDFNLDGVPDVLWQDPVSGTVQLWYMGGTAAGAQGSVFQSAVNLTGAMSTKAVAVADFNQDGHPDVIFQDPVTGAATVYYYTGAQGITANGTAVLSTGNPWYIAGPH